MARQFNIEATIRTRDESSGELRTVQGSIEALGGSLDNLVLTGGDVVGAMSAAGDSIRRNLQIQTQIAVLDRELRAGGSSFAEFFAAVTRSTQGTVSELAATVRGVQALKLGLDEAQLPELFGVAAARAQLFGTTTDGALSDITRGIARLSPLILDNLGFTVDLSDSYDAYAKSLGKTADQLTKVEQQQAVANEVLRQGRDAIQEVQGAQSDLNLATQQVAAIQETLKTRLSLVTQEWIDQSGVVARFLPFLDQLQEKVGDVGDEYLESIRESEAFEASLVSQAEAFFKLRQESEQIAGILGDTTQAMDIFSRARERAARLDRELADAQERSLEFLKDDILTRSEAETVLERFRNTLADQVTLYDAGELSARAFGQRQEALRSTIEALEAIIRGEAVSIEEFNAAQGAAAEVGGRVADALGRQAAAADAATEALRKNADQAQDLARSLDGVAASAERAASASSFLVNSGPGFQTFEFNSRRNIAPTRFGSVTFPNRLSGGGFVTRIR